MNVETVEQILRRRMAGLAPDTGEPDAASWRSTVRRRFLRALDAAGPSPAELMHASVRRRTLATCGPGLSWTRRKCTAPCASRQRADAAPRWYDDELLERTKRVWSKQYGREVGDQEAAEILLNVRLLAGTLAAAWKGRGLR